MPSQIDITQPPEGQATTAAVRQNFAFAKEEIEALQTGVAAAEININNNTEAIASTNNQLNNFMLQQAGTDQNQDSGMTSLADNVNALQGQVNELSIRVSNLEAIPPYTPPAFNWSQLCSIPTLRSTTAQGTDRWTNDTQAAVIAMVSLNNLSIGKQLIIMVDAAHLVDTIVTQDGCVWATIVVPVNHTMLITLDGVAVQTNFYTVSIAPNE